jgi:hypothetical protein
VVLWDDAGRIIATSGLVEGEINGPDCVFRFGLNEVPKARFYQQEISHRGRVTFSFEGLQANQFHMDVDLGKPKP